LEVKVCQKIGPRITQIDAICKKTNLLLGLTSGLKHPCHERMINSSVFASHRAAFASGPLAHLGVLRFTGGDALSFLQGQLSNDTGRLAQASPVFGAYSNPQGRVLALIYLLPHSTGVSAILPREILPATLQRLRKFVMRSKVQIEDVSGLLPLSGYHGADALQSAGLPVPAGAQTYIEQHGIGIAAVGHNANRYWVLGAAVSGSGGSDAELQRIERDWRLADIRAGLPQVYAATSEAFVAQMLNLDLLDGISFTKGCYTGQEIIARTQHLGRIKRRLFRLHLPAGGWSIGQSLRLADGRQGRLVEVIEREGRTEALAVLGIEATAGAAEPTGADPESGVGVDAAELPLPYSIP
jgi:tRNA-modifying protein YgfZ